jgi:hypothetical protein
MIYHPQNPLPLLDLLRLFDSISDALLARKLARLQSPARKPGWKFNPAGVL